MKRGDDGAAELSVGGSTVVNFAPGQLASVTNSDGKMRLSFSRDSKPDKFFGNVMAVDTGTGDVSVLDQDGKLSTLEPGSRINVTSAGIDRGHAVWPRDEEPEEEKLTTAGYG